MFTFIAATWNDGWVGKTVLAIISVCGATLIAFALIIAVWANDFSSATQTQGGAVVVGKQFIPAHTTLTCIVAGKTAIPTINFAPDRWVVTLKRDGETGTTSVLKRLYDSLHEGQSVEIIYRTGRFSGFCVEEIKTNSDGLPLLSLSQDKIMPHPK